MIKNSTFKSVLAAGVLLFALSGCGSTPTGVDPSMDDTGYGTDPTQTAPIGTDPSTSVGTNPYAGTTGTTPTTSSVPLQDLTATVTSKKNGTLFGIGTLKATIEVSNPNSVARTGTLTVTWLNGGKPGVTAAVTQQVSLGPNETQSLDFSDKSWRDDDVSVSITSDAATTGSTASYGSSYGATTPYGSTTGY